MDDDICCDSAGCHEFATIHVHHVQHYVSVREEHWCDNHVRSARIDRIVNVAQRRDESQARRGLIKFELGLIVFYKNSEQERIVLIESNGTRQFTFNAGLFESWTIINLVKNQELSRPLTHAAMFQIIQALDALVECTVIDVVDNTGAYHARLKMRRGEDCIIVDIRPSDALALAIISQTPIYIAEDLV